VDNDIAGTWHLISWELHDDRGHVSYPMGRQPDGRLMYTQDGFMCVLITGRDRRRTVPGDAALGIPDATITAARRSISYAGTYERTGDAIVHHVELSTFPDWNGTDQHRLIAWRDGHLVLYTPPSLVGGKQQAAYLTWERLKKP
jgi:lipocalin-like protein